MSKVDTSGKAKQYKGLDARVGVLLSVEMRDWLQAHTKATDIPLTVHVRRALDMYRASIDRKAKRVKPVEPAPF
jgi:hypothetical protein